MRFKSASLGYMHACATCVQTAHHIYFNYMRKSMCLHFSAVAVVVVIVFVVFQIDIWCFARVRPVVNGRDTHIQKMLK